MLLRVVPKATGEEGAVQAGDRARGGASTGPGGHGYLGNRCEPREEEKSPRQNGKGCPEVREDWDLLDGAARRPTGDPWGGSLGKGVGWGGERTGFSYQQGLWKLGHDGSPGAPTHSLTWMEPGHPGTLGVYTQISHSLQKS